ncbi:hypothetical protein [Mesorhizobium kowhaii]|uniref:Uncharacterized protein n=1 Tax=Mesorhizobium kowhaii TaxID=1300272 RepID=A0A2W7CHR6_9HYPH|nr:hypothetical protein [Mesorhizobium kowhaii]PZV33379.1 hypothetical protein B5V02_39355 [Mesorhizobium kowhaii]
MDLKNLLSIVRKPASPRADLAFALASLDLESAEVRASQLETERRRILISGDDRDLAEIEDKITVANREIERRFALRDELQSRLAKIDEADEIAGRKRRYDEATKLSGEVRKALARYPSLARQIIDMLAVVAEAEAAIAAANDDLPEGAAPIAAAEVSVRGTGADIPPLASTILLPSFDPAKPDLWQPCGPSGYMGNYHSGIEVVLARLAELRGARS